MHLHFRKREREEERYIVKNANKFIYEIYIGNCIFQEQYKIRTFDMLISSEINILKSIQ